MRFTRSFSSSVERVLAARLMLILALPLLGLLFFVVFQFQETAHRITKDFLRHEAKSYGMLLVERISVHMLAEISPYTQEEIPPLDEIRLPLDVVGDGAMSISLLALGIDEHVSMSLAQIAPDMTDTKNIVRCVSLDPDACQFQNMSIENSWELRLVTLFDTDTSIYIKTGLQTGSSVLSPSMLVSLFPLVVGLMLAIATYYLIRFLRRKLEPIGQIRQAVTALEAGDLGVQIDCETDDEFGQLSQAFNTMSSELERSFSFQRRMAELDEKILSGADLLEVFTRCAQTLRECCDAQNPVLVEVLDASWRVYTMHNETAAAFETTKEPDSRTYSPGAIKFPILHGERVIGWLFVRLNSRGHSTSVIELLRKLSVGILSIQRDQELFQQANYDTLTGQLNRYAFSSQLVNKIARAKRADTNGALIFLDLDGFKKINDAQGHSAGDQLLTIVASRIASILREEDLLARLGGDEFALALDSFGSEDELLSFLQRIMDHLQHPIKMGDLEVQVQASMGVCLFPKDGDEVEGLLKKADIAMYRAKRVSGSSFEFYNKGLNKIAERQLQVQTRLGTAIRSGNLEVFLQPKLDLASGLITSSEALSRWTDDELGFVSPPEFIEVAERTGLIRELTENIFETLAPVLIEPPQGLRSIAVNISPQELDRSDFSETLMECLNRAQIPPERIELEVTESNFMEEPQRVADLLSKIKETGMKVSLDDFGTGYSSLNLLRKLPLDYLKIDKSFIDEIGEQVSAGDLVAKIVELARNLGMGIVAEGVETQAQLELLEGMSCTYAQGYLISKPLPLSEAVAFIEDWNQSVRQQQNVVRQFPG